MRFLLKIFLKWLPLAVATTLLALMVYVGVQQSYRMGANDPQIQIAEETANKIESGTQPSTLIPSQKVNMTSDLSVFINYYDQNKNVVVGNGYVDGKYIATPPIGTFDSTIHEPRFFSTVTPSGENRFSWQPKDDVRAASVLLPVDSGNKGYVLVGRSLREVELRAESMLKIAFLGWLVTMGATLFTVGVVEYIKLYILKDKK